MQTMLKSFSGLVKDTG